MAILYEQDYGLWAEEMARLLQEGKFSELDIDNLVDEVLDLSKRERDRLLSSIRLIVHHLLKWDFQPQKRSRSWKNTIERERTNISHYLKDSPSLKRYLYEEWLSHAYSTARLDASSETNLDFPKECPYTITDVLERPISGNFPSS
ncbi:MAG: DUF29 domain-containing protein [Snowella sp.]|nr:DUF29 domain-containing protein [Snowella sp.]